MASICIAANSALRLTSTKRDISFVFQDVRGRYMSEGTFIEMRPHLDNKKIAQDRRRQQRLYDTIEWLLKNVPNNNGNAGIWGISYPGFFTSASIIDSHPALKAASPQAPMTDLFMATTPTTGRLHARGKFWFLRLI